MTGAEWRRNPARSLPRHLSDGSLATEPWPGIDLHPIRSTPEDSPIGGVLGEEGGAWERAKGGEKYGETKGYGEQERETEREREQKSVKRQNHKQTKAWSRAAITHKLYRLHLFCSVLLYRKSEDLVYIITHSTQPISLLITVTALNLFPTRYSFSFNTQPIYIVIQFQALIFHIISNRFQCSFSVTVAAVYFSNAILSFWI